MTQLIITLMDNGSIEVTGPLRDKLLCYGLIEVARDTIRNSNQSTIIKPPNASIVGEIKKNPSDS